MKALLICPDERFEVAALAQSGPLALIDFLGKPFLFYWIDHMAGAGVTELTILTSDRPEQVRAVVGDGARWGLKIEVLPQARELTGEEARKKYQVEKNVSWLPSPHDVVVADFLPEFPNLKLFRTYHAFFSAAQAWISHSQTPDRIGLKEIEAGVWVGLNSRIHPTASLIAPCWIGDHVCVGANAVVGPMTILENKVMVSPRASVTGSFVASNTYIGSMLDVKDSIASQNQLTHLQTNSTVTLNDAFLISAVERKNRDHWITNLVGRFLAFMALILTSPAVIVVLLRSLLTGKNPVKECFTTTVTGAPPRRVVATYYELTGSGSYLRRWPWLCNIVRGQFRWFGNRPLAPDHASSLYSDFDNLWLTAPIGLFSQADACDCPETFSDEAKAHAAFYATTADVKLKLLILGRILLRWNNAPAQPDAALEMINLNPKLFPASRSVTE